MKTQLNAASRLRQTPVLAAMNAKQAAKFVKEHFDKYDLGVTKVSTGTTKSTYLRVEAKLKKRNRN